VAEPADRVFWEFELLPCFQSFSLSLSTLLNECDWPFETADAFGISPHFPRPFRPFPLFGTAFSSQSYFKKRQALFERVVVLPYKLEQLFLGAPFFTAPPYLFGDIPEKLSRSFCCSLAFFDDLSPPTTLGPPFTWRSGPPLFCPRPFFLFTAPLFLASLPMHSHFFSPSSVLQIFMTGPFSTSSVPLLVFSFANQHLPPPPGLPLDKGT